jgi:hypothetical protein
MQRILWGQGQYASYYGQIGGFRFFTISWGTKRNDPEPWKLDTDLPIFLAKVKTDFESVDQAKAMAERVMNSFVTKIGAKWVED